MSYESVITDLKTLMRRDLLEIDPKEHKARVEGESDRANLIMQAAVLERFVVHKLVEQMETINADETAAIFQFEGPCGSFSSRIKMAQALGIISRKMRKRLDLIREMRNVAAHAHPDIDFSTKEIRNAVCALVDAKHRDVLDVMPPAVLRSTFHFLVGKFIRQMVYGDDETGIEVGMATFRKAAIKNGLLPSPDKSPQPKSRGRPRKGGKA